MCSACSRQVSSPGKLIKRFGEEPVMILGIGWNFAFFGATTMLCQLPRTGRGAEGSGAA